VTEFNIREFQSPEDYPAVRSLWEHTGPGIQLRTSDDPKEIQKKLQRDPDLFLVAEGDGKILASVFGGFDGRRGMVYHLAVSRAYQNKGIGRVLMEELERRLKTKGCIRSYLLVTVENKRAMRFYEKQGWVRMDNVFTYGKDMK
jgi:ribosomal protein S18 acetylase RimI-like enzyme